MGEQVIEEISPGDIVYAYDFETGSTVERKVMDTCQNFTSYWVDVQVGEDTIHATRGHQFWVVSEGQWIEAAFLKSGMSVLSSAGRNATIEDVVIRELERPETTYNFVVADEHNYFVGGIEILVHNGVYGDQDYPPPTKIGENFQFNFDQSKNFVTSRQAGRDRARRRNFEAE